MKPPVTIIGRLVHTRGLDRPLIRRVIFVVLITLALLLTVFPERHRAAASLTPTDPESLGLSGTLGQLGAINNVFGNQAAVEVAMRVAKSIYVRDRVINDLKLTKRLGTTDRIRIHRWLERKIGIRSLRGGIVQLEMKDGDADLARDVVGQYAIATQDRLAEISRNQTAYKRGVLTKLVSEASINLAQAQGAYDSFRLRTRYADPKSSMEAIGESIPQLEATIKGKEVQISAAREMYADGNIIIQQMTAELAALRGQLNAAKATNPIGDNSVGRVVAASSQLFKLERDLGIARALYDNYMRYLQGTAVENLTSTANMRILEPPFVDTARQYSYPALAAAIALFLLWMAIEFYRLRPPVGDRLMMREAHG